MRLCITHHPVPRTWTVELRPHPGGPTLHCPRCTPSGQRVLATAAPPAALAHLAGHARRDVVPAHLRTCQCHERGCRWHGRHRGCDGPVLLVLTLERSGRLWRLADICAACTAATPYAAVVPDTAPKSLPQQALSPQALVRGTLAHLASTLPGDTSTQARLLALQCALRTNTHGRMLLPAGLLRALRLGPHTPAWHELEDAHWLTRFTAPSTGHTAVQLLDHPGPLPARRHRIRAADWALRTARQPANQPSFLQFTADRWPCGLDADVSPSRSW
ncbi:hypothetical protein ACFYXH_40800 [Streptomyces sp. NPDC002730]|uniref:hypothetical protein n=1 Tax=Streptomyces sp. NPDC002730 TaxID=3364662 RepID=UPI0036A50624